jgi:hypothetical protein
MASAGLVGHAFRLSVPFGVLGLLGFLLSSLVRLLSLFLLPAGLSWRIMRRVVFTFSGIPLFILMTAL